MFFSWHFYRKFNKIPVSHKILLQIQEGWHSFPKHLKWERTPRLLHHSAGALWRAPSWLSQWDGAVWLQHYRGLRSRVWFPSGREREDKKMQDSSCWPETYVESIRKPMQHKYHTVKARLLLSLWGRQQSQQHGWLRLWQYSFQIQTPLPNIYLSPTDKGNGLHSPLSHRLTCLQRGLSSSSTQMGLTFISLLQ